MTEVFFSFQTTRNNVVGINMYSNDTYIIILLLYKIYVYGIDFNSVNL